MEQGLGLTRVDNRGRGVEEDHPHLGLGVPGLGEAGEQGAGLLGPSPEQCVPGALKI